MKTAQLKFLASMKSGEFIDSIDIAPEGNFPVFGGNGLRGYTSKCTHSGTVPLIGRQGALCGNVNYVSGQFYATEHAIVADPISPVNPRWLYWTLLSLNLNQYSMAAAQPGLAVEVIERVRVHKPGTVQQERIANFLDDKTARIDALIAEKERLLDSLKSYIHARVSQLLREGVSGASLHATNKPFVAEAPAHWRVTNFKRALSGVSQGWSPQCESRPAEANEWGVLKVGCVNGPFFDVTENKALPGNLEPDLSCVIRKGDVLMSRANTRDLVGMTALVEQDYPSILLCDKLYRLELKEDWVSPEYAVLLLRSEASRRQIELGASGASSSMQNISQDVLRELVAAFPPLDEQHAIVVAANAVKKSCADLSEHIQLHIERLREYRSSLISAAVTGELDAIAATSQQE